jgi:predicted MFS family arabinose efflux permease
MGFLASLAPILAVPIATMVAVASFVQWQTALAFTVGVAVFCVLAVRFHSRHNRPFEWDDHLTNDRMDEARESLVRGWKKDNVED